jgi:tetratricopeptide (TPR) repeat protein
MMNVAPGNEASGNVAPAALLARAVALHQQGALDAAEPLYRRVLDDAPRHADALHLLGVLAAQQGRHAEAIALIAAAIAEVPGEASFHANLGRACKAAGQQGNALAAFDQAIALGSSDPGVFSDRGSILLELGRAPAALESFERASALHREDAGACNNRGNALRALDRNAEALDSFDRAIALRPDYADAFCNRGNILQELDRFAEALASYDQALVLQPDHVDALANRGAVLRALGRYSGALDDYDRALRLRPDHIAARFGRSLCLLQMGDLARGWAAYEWRWRTARFAARAGRFAQAPWLGTGALAGKTILLHAEQGFGDTLQFCRYVAPVAARGARVVLEVARPLARLMATLDDAAEVIAEGDKLPAFDLHCPLMSLPLAFGTTLETIPPPARLVPVPDRVAGWQLRLAGAPGVRVGLVWAGSSNKTYPEGRAIDRRRSITLDHYAPLAAVAGVSFMSVQKGETARQTAAPPAGMALLDVTAELDDFADTAALIAALDLVISVDTAVAHLAGSLGKPVWILTPFDADWRWLAGRSDSPWYPTARLFRQPAIGDWASVIADVVAALRGFVGAGVASV